MIAAVRQRNSLARSEIAEIQARHPSYAAPRSPTQDSVESVLPPRSPALSSRARSNAQGLPSRRTSCEKSCSAIAHAVWLQRWVAGICLTCSLLLLGDSLCCSFAAVAKLNPSDEAPGNRRFPRGFAFNWWGTERLASRGLCAPIDGAALTLHLPSGALINRGWPDRRLLPDRRGDGRHTAQPIRAVLAGRRRPLNSTVGMKGEEIAVWLRLS